MKAVLCDCCHKIVDKGDDKQHIPYNLVIIHKDEDNIATSYDFCDDCLNMIFNSAPHAVMKLKKGAKIV